MCHIHKPRTLLQALKARVGVGVYSLQYLWRQEPTRRQIVSAFVEQHEIRALLGVDLHPGLALIQSAVFDAATAVIEGLKVHRCTLL